MNTRFQRFPALILLWLILPVIALSGCTLFDSGDQDKDSDLAETRIALAILQTGLAGQSGPADPDGTPTLAPAGSQPMQQTAAALAVTQTAMAIANQPPTPDLAATQVAVSVQQTLAASGGAGSPATGTPTTLALPGIAPSETPTTLALPGIAPSETPPAYAPPPPWGFVQISDEFSNPNSGWPQMQQSTYQTWYANGFYHISNYQFTSEAFVTVGGNYTDIWMQTRAMITQDQIGAAYGLTCRHQDANNFYFFEITNSSTYMISKYWGGTLKLIGMAAPMTSNVIRPFDYNVMEATCVGNALSLTVNGVHLITVYDNTFASGDVGLVAGAADDTPMTAAFDFFLAGY